MPRQAKLDSPGTLHHVMIRGTEGKPLFHQDKGHLNFLSRISKVSEGAGRERNPSMKQSFGAVRFSAEREDPER